MFHILASPNSWQVSDSKSHLRRPTKPELREVEVEKPSIEIPFRVPRLNEKLLTPLTLFLLHGERLHYLYTALLAKSHRNAKFGTVCEPSTGQNCCTATFTCHELRFAQLQYFTHTLPHHSSQAKLPGKTALCVGDTRLSKGWYAQTCANRTGNLNWKARSSERGCSSLWDGPCSSTAFCHHLLAVSHPSHN